MEPRDYLHLYLGCPCTCDGKDGILQGVDYNSHIDMVTILFDDGDWMVYNDLSMVKLKLRRREDMTDKECDDFGINFENGEYDYDIFQPDCIIATWNAYIGIQDVAKRLNAMRKVFLDCDGLIDAGLAIDAKTITS